MLPRILKTLALAALLALTALQIAAQPSPPTFEIRIANSAPPRARRERVPVRPDRDSVWTRGFWRWEGSRWEWSEGRWNRPEQRSHRWVSARYAREGNSWRYEPPHWSHQQVIEGDEYRRWKEHKHHH